MWSETALVAPIPILVRETLPEASWSSRPQGGGCRLLFGRRCLGVDPHVVEESTRRWPHRMVQTVPICGKADPFAAIVVGADGRRRAENIVCKPA
jgi:hypothetical protein